jgi:hypothetical protein
MCVREFLREVKLTLDDVRGRLYLLQGDEIGLWRSLQNLEYNAEDTLPVIRELFARMQPAQVGTPNGVVRYVEKHVTPKSPSYMHQHCQFTMCK